MHLGQLGMTFAYILVALLLLDFEPFEKWKLVRIFKRVRRLGMISLTVYIFESILTASFSRIISIIPAFSGWNDKMFIVIIFGACMSILWMIIARFWEKIRYRP